MAPLSVMHDFIDRAQEKAESRERDMSDIRLGRMLPSEVAKRNDFFANVDVSAFRLVAVGGRPFKR